MSEMQAQRAVRHQAGNTKLTRRIFCRALVFALLAGSVFGQPLRAQQRRLAPKEIGQIVDAVLDTLIPPSERLSRITVAKRGIFLDVARTLKSFGYDDSATMPTLADLHLRTVVKPGSHHMLDDCKQIGPGSCTQLGWSTYVTITRLAGRNAEMRLSVEVVWPDRSGEAFVEGAAPTRRTNLVGYFLSGTLTRSFLGRWKFVRDKTTAAM